ncbi:hypothetical protein J6590_067853 [Homalodisca vitripennis]|nr:hypothetical protein J6590_067853 [Homalodisca vitripennis]
MFGITKHLESFGFRNPTLAVSILRKLSDSRIFRPLAAPVLNRADTESSNSKTLEAFTLINQIAENYESVASSVILYKMVYHNFLLPCIKNRSILVRDKHCIT